MARINTYKETYIYREFLTEKSLFVMAYNKNTAKFYQKILTNIEWSTVINNFTLVELETIFQVCYENQPGYDLQINQTENSLVLHFKCKEKIKTYQWSIELLEKNLSDMEEISNAFSNININLNKTITDMKPKVDDENIFVDDGSELHAVPYQNETMAIINSYIDKLENHIKELFTRQRKELHLISYIAAENLKNSVQPLNTVQPLNMVQPLNTAQPLNTGSEDTNPKIKKSSKRNTHDKKNKSKHGVDDKNSVEEKEYSCGDDDDDTETSTDSSDGEYYNIPGYEEVGDMFDVPLNTHLKYITIEKDGSIGPEYGGFLSEKSSSCKYIFLQQERNGGKCWKVAVKNKIFFKKCDKKRNQ